ncbi:DNA gyrase inhibitor YacG [Rhizorhapis sp.]|uniref:DNA gyrase inhibitor YacG n=1 Tax=Rhizorhapis sp. TaxID=1968842 RepID=UPI002B499C78|nr:DNA gyrase inhibitor YacG [Rhizorhapis sp.]HKR16613.1 DNA gyrase inhibitor YacG [Rhizorhapis sp.]HKX36305.1 DNA gyrase inhibitor YacG [Rhizorhapis sp.]
MQNRKSRSSACPVCGKPQTAEFHPFCSRGCRDRDLLNWLGEGYKVPGQPTDEDRETTGENGVDKVP